MMTIAVIDDNETNLLFMEMLLSRIEDVTAEFFASPVEALQRISSESVDLVLVDYMMPELDGIEFIRRYRESASSAGVPVVMITAHDEREIRGQAVAVGATDFLSKPVDTFELTTRVRNLLSLRAAHNRLRDTNSWLSEEVIRATEKIRQREHELIVRLVRATEYRDEQTGGHVQRIAQYARLIAEQMGLPVTFQVNLLLAAPMHDIGKVAIPDHILKKPGRLTPDEFDLMKTHTAIGHHILAGSESDLIRMAAEIALSHHERMDGRGYPEGRAGDEIPLAARIVAVTDVFDALASRRPYKEPWPLETCRDNLLQIAGSHLDPTCVAAFLARWNDIQKIAAICDVDFSLLQVGLEEAA